MKFFEAWVSFGSAYEECQRILRYLHIHDPRVSQDMKQYNQLCFLSAWLLLDPEGVGISPHRSVERHQMTPRESRPRGTRFET
jgi:hypothetical protein